MTRKSKSWSRHWAKPFSSRRVMVILFALLALSLFTWLGLVKATLSEQADLHEIPVPEIDLDQFHGFSKDALKSFPQPEQQP